MNAQSIITQVPRGGTPLQENNQAAPTTGNIAHISVQYIILVSLETLVNILSFRWFTWIVEVETQEEVPKKSFFQLLCCCFFSDDRGQGYKEEDENSDVTTLPSLKILGPCYSDGQYTATSSSSFRFGGKKMPCTRFGRNSGTQLLQGI
jgi:hypothetical protein